MRQKRDNGLPYNWRIQASKMLEDQGVTLTSQQIGDLLYKQYGDKELLLKVLTVQKQIRQEHRAKARKIKALKRA